MEKWKKALLIFIGILLILIGGFLIYTNDFYRADSSVYEVLDSENSTIYYEENIIVFNADNENKLNKGLVFYPGGKVEYISYIPLLHELSKQGVTAVLIKMPLNLAIFNKDAAERAYELLPSIPDWYVGGHSLGGAMASRYIDSSSKDVKGLVMLAAYPEKEKSIPTISIYGSQDQILSQEDINKASRLIEIDGGNHAYFGNYGEQNGDGKATITRKKQQEITVEAIVDFIVGH